MITHFTQECFVMSHFIISTLPLIVDMLVIPCLQMHVNIYNIYYPPNICRYCYKVHVFMSYF